MTEEEPGSGVTVEDEPGSGVTVEDEPGSGVTVEDEPGSGMTDEVVPGPITEMAELTELEPEEISDEPEEDPIVQDVSSRHMAIAAAVNEKRRLDMELPPLIKNDWLHCLSYPLAGKLSMMGK